jgi:putative oxidoreductase
MSSFLRLILITLFTYTAISKTIDHILFYQQLANIPAIRPLAGFITVFIPLIELITALLLLFPKSEMIGWWLSAILFSAFIIYILAMMILVPKLPCSCGGIIEGLSWTNHLLINITLAFFSWLKIYIHCHNKTKYAYKGVS